MPHISPSIWSNPIHILAFGFGAGLAKNAPGTVGTLVAVPLYLLLLPVSLFAYVAITALLALFGIWLCQVTARDLGVHDHPGIVWDEIVGYLVTMTAAPSGFWWIVVGFGLFRLFDIWKPWPISVADRAVSGGLGIMLDDVIAGVYAWVILQLIAVWVG